MNGPDQTRGPKLLWQALLVLTPTLLLAGIGLVFLRQTWIWAEREGQASARQTANELALVRVPGLLRSGLPSFDPYSTRRSTRLDPSPDPVLELLSGRLARVAIVLDEKGALIYPPPLAEWPAPQSLDAELPSPPAPTRAKALTHLGSLEDPTAGAALQNRTFPAQSDPREIAGRAAYRLARTRERSGDFPGARREYEMVLEQFPDVLTEPGLALKIVAGLRLIGPEFLSTSTAGQRAGLVSALTAEAVYRPTPLSKAILHRLATMGAQADLVKSANRLFAAHEHARELYSQVRGQIGGVASGPGQEQALGWVEDNSGRKWLMVPSSNGRNRWLLFLTETMARKMITEAVAVCPTSPCFRTGIEVAGEPLIAPPAGASTVASVNTSDELSALGGIRATVYLTDPGTFYARVHIQTVWLSILIVLSIAAVGVGLRSAGRAFRQQRQLVELKSNFVSSVSHELRAPIASMRLLTEELVDLGSAGQQRQAEYHHLIIRECKRLTQLIENVLEFSRSKPSRPNDSFTPADPVGLIDETLRLMSPIAAEQQIRLHFCAPAQKVPTIRASAVGLQQALINLIDNAIKYSAPGGIVTLGVAFIPAANHDHDRIEIWVEDKSKGISPEEQERIFEPFYRCGAESRRETQGVGLGLTIVRQTIEAHGGEVKVKSALGQGSRFTLSLPVKAER